MSKQADWADDEATAILNTVTSCPVDLWANALRHAYKRGLEDAAKIADDGYMGSKRITRAILKSIP